MGSRPEPPVAMYDYFEERPFGSLGPAKRKRDIQGRLATGVTPEMILEHVFSQYPWRKTRELENRASAPIHEGVWPINHNRVVRYFGDPGYANCQWNSDPNDWPSNIDELARQFRIHHYFRVWSANDCREIVCRGVEVRVSMEVTEEWHDPPGGIIEIPPPTSPVLGAHAIPIHEYDTANDRFPFQNSWGAEWGDHGRGSLPAPLIDRFLIEAWCPIGQGVEPPVDAKSGLTRLLWKSAAAGREVHGREIIDAASGERIAWTFLVRRDDHLDIEEFFVWPLHRRKGFARELVKLILEFVRGSGLKPRVFVPFADADPTNRQGLLRTLEMLGLTLKPSPNRSAAFIATGEPTLAAVPEPPIPDRPASVRDNLRPESGTRLYTVWFGTNRKPINDTDAEKGFSGERDNRVHYGNCKVAIPKSHRFGSVGSSWWKRWFRLTDDRLQVVERVDLQCDQFWSELTSAISEASPDARHGLVFLHGYNTDFDKAAIRAAQIGFDLKIPGATAFFSWPSCGTLYGYPADESCIEASEPFIADFLYDFATRTGANHVHIIAHSMGNRGLLRALQRLETRLRENPRVQFSQVILAAPDIDVDTFAGLAELYTRFARRTTVYSSPADNAINASQFLHSYPRVGLTPPVTVVRGIDTIEVPRFNVFDFLGHGYYAEAEGLLHDIFDLIRRNAPPEDRQRLTSAKTESGLAYWIMDA